MLILGIESSCDETAAAVVEDGRVVKSSLIASQIQTHQLFGGVVPEIAAREHLKKIDPIVRQALVDAGVTLRDIDAIAVTQGPGLIGALLVGVSYAKGLAIASGKPLVPVNHVHAHVHGAFLGLKIEPQELFPCLAMVVSGGHTNLYFMTSPTHFELLATSIDDACGECFDKVAKIMGLGYPGGPAVERLAANGDPSVYPMPRMVSQKSRLAYSYSGLKTHMVNLWQREKEHISEQNRADLCAAFQEEALHQIVRKFGTALELRPETKSILIAGGVAANKRFRQMMQEKISRPACFPELRFCSDNAAMIAALGYFEFKQNKHPNQVWDAFSRYQY